METPPSPRPLKLRLLICNPKSYGPKNIVCKGVPSSGNIPRTREDPYLPGVFSYECKSFTEWEKLAEGISRQISNQNAFFARAHFVDTTLPPSPAARVDAVANGLYVAVPANQLQGPAGAHDSGAAGSPPAPATITTSSPEAQTGSAPSYAEATQAAARDWTQSPAFAGQNLDLPQTGGDSSSGRVGEAREESEPTLSADTSDTGAPVSEFDPVRSPESADTPESVEPTPDTAAATGAAATEEGDPPEAEPASKRAPAPAKPAAAKKSAKKK